MTTKKTAFAPVKTKRNPQLKKVTGFIKLHRHSQAETEIANYIAITAKSL